MNTENKIEEVTNEIRNTFAPKIVLINHEKALPVDTVCSNLALKYNFLYLSVYQLIKDNVTKKTELGVKLAATKRNRKFAPSFSQIRDDFDERTYSPIHYDMALVTQLIKKTINERLTNQSHVLLEGMCNNDYLQDEADQMELRIMDDFFTLEQNVFPVGAVFRLTYKEESEILQHEKEDPEVQAQRLKALAEKEKQKRLAA